MLMAHEPQVVCKNKTTDNVHVMWRALRFCVKQCLKHAASKLEGIESSVGYLTSLLENMLMHSNTKVVEQQ